MQMDNLGQDVQIRKEGELVIETRKLNEIRELIEADLKAIVLTAMVDAEDILDVDIERLEILIKNIKKLKEQGNQSKAKIKGIQGWLGANN